MNDRRQSNRPAVRVPVRVFGPDGGYPKVACTWDLTRGGLCLEFFDALPPARMLTVQVSPHRRLRAFVRWVIDGGPGGRRLIGCEFSSVQLV